MHLFFEVIRFSAVWLRNKSVQRQVTMHKVSETLPWQPVHEKPKTMWLDREPFAWRLTVYALSDAHHLRSETPLIRNVLDHGIRHREVEVLGWKWDFQRVTLHVSRISEGLRWRIKIQDCQIRRPPVWMHPEGIVTAHVYDGPAVWELSCEPSRSLTPETFSEQTVGPPHFAD
jgi:hypothetical protein